MRSPLAPDLPTLNELGIAGYDLTAWFAAFVPAKTPKPIVERLNAAFREALTDKDVASKLLGAGIEPQASSPDELKAFVISEILQNGQRSRQMRRSYPSEVWNISDPNVQLRDVCFGSKADMCMQLGMSAKCQ